MKLYWWTRYVLLLHAFFSKWRFSQIFYFFIIFVRIFTNFDYIKIFNFDISHIEGSWNPSSLRFDNALKIPWIFGSILRVYRLDEKG